MEIIQSASHVFMVRPSSFRFNEQTAVNNHFQQSIGSLSPAEVSSLALREFDALVDKLRQNGIRVSVFDDTPFPEKPDCLFPNNWISFHDNDLTVIYPMFAANRRWERRMDILHHLRPDGAIIDLSEFESNNLFLEGTGSLVLDRVNRVAYAAISQRTHQEVLDVWAEKLNYQLVVFHASQLKEGSRLPVYHTNVVMAICSDIIVICAESIVDPAERNLVVDSLEDSGRIIIHIDAAQMEHFAGNILELRNTANEKIFVMSDTAFGSFNDEQLGIFASHGQVLHSALNTIETFGGGSARCMLAEVF